MNVTLQNIWETLNQQLEGTYNQPERRRLYLLLCQHVLGISSAKLLAFPETKVTNNDYKTILEYIQRLKTNEPVQYVLGFEEFYGYKFHTNVHVLIPRPETEELVDWILKSESKGNLNVVDVGTGSGCIAVTLAGHLPESNVKGLDISEGALQVAKTNAILNNVNVEFLQCDVLSHSVFLRFEAETFDVIVSNPPYICENEKVLMQPNVLNHEPHTALFVPDTTPLLFYEAIARWGLHALKPGGWLYFEINEKYGSEVDEMLVKLTYTKVELKHDINGKARMVRALKPIRE